MKPFVLNSPRFFKKDEQNLSGKKDENTDSVTTTYEKNNPENPKHPPFYEALISIHSRGHGDFWDLSGGLIGI